MLQKKKKEKLRSAYYSPANTQVVADHRVLRVLFPKRICRKNTLHQNLHHKIIVHIFIKLKLRAEASSA